MAEATRDPRFSWRKTAWSAIPVVRIARGYVEDGEFREEDHPRREDGKFGTGSGGPTASHTVEAVHSPFADHDAANVAFIKAQLTGGSTMPSKDAADLIVHSLVEKPFDMALFKLPKDHIESMSDEQIAELARDPAMKATTYDRPDTMGMLWLVTDPADQKRVADGLVQLSKRDPDAHADVDMMARKLPGDLMDHIADNINPDSKLAEREAIRMFSRDHSTFLPAFVQGWTVMGGTTAYHRAFDALADYQSNDGKSLWMGRNPLDHTKERQPLSPSRNLRANLEKLHGDTQEFYRQKFSRKGKPPPDLSTIPVVAQRGVGNANVNEYVPAPVESWTTDKQTPHRFGKMMGKNSYAVMTTNTHYGNVLMSWESLKGTWPEEKTLKGKKEIVLLGGALDSIDKEEYRK